MTEKRNQVLVRVTPDFLAALDDWRKTASGLPSRAEAIRQLAQVELTMRAPATPEQLRDSESFKLTRSQAKALLDANDHLYNVYNILNNSFSEIPAWKLFNRQLRKVQKEARELYFGVGRLASLYAPKRRERSDADLIGTR